MKKILEFLLSKILGYNYTVDEYVDNSVIIHLFIEKSFSIIRGYINTVGVQKKGMIFLGKGSKFYVKNKIKLGKNIKIGKYCTFSALSKNGLVIGDCCSIKDFTSIVVSTDFSNVGLFINIGNNVGLGEFSYLGGAGGLRIGDNTIIGQYFSTHPENHIFDDVELLIRKQGVTRKGIDIGSNCWIGAKVTFIDGASVGSGCIVGAGSVVIGRFPENVVVAGVPARIIKKRESFEKNTNNCL